MPARSDARPHQDRATQAAAIVGDGYDTVLVAPKPSDDAVVQLLKATIASGS